jgi:hypothetical protein
MMKLARSPLLSSSLAARALVLLLSLSWIAACGSDDAKPPGGDTKGKLGAASFGGFDVIVAKFSPAGNLQ